MRRIRTLALALVLASGGAGCHKDKPRPAPAARADVALAIFVDDKPVASTANLGGEPRPLTEVVPGAPALAAWLALEAIDASGKVHTTMAPARNQAGKVPVVAVDKDGVWLGYQAGAAAPVDVVRGVTRVTIKAKGDAGQIAAQAGHDDHGGGDSSGNREHAGEARPAVSADLQIAITGVHGDSVFTGDKLAGLPVVKAPSGDTETPGWSLTDVLAAAGIVKPEVVHLTDGEGATLRLDAADFDPAKVVLYLKLNRSGVIRFRVFRKAGETWEVGGELRGITKIHVVK